MVQVIGICSLTNWDHFWKQVKLFQILIILNKTENYWKFYFEFEGEKTKVCKNFMISLYQISKKR